jgi:hypothetical protein
VKPCLLLSLCLLLPPAARAQAPASAPPPPGAGGPNTSVQELLPEIGKIGAEVGLFGGLSRNPFEIGDGADFGGFIALPLVRVGNGKLSYEIQVALAMATSEPFTVTDSVAFVANLAAGVSPADALAGPPRAPFPVVRTVRTRSRLLHLSPFGLRYTYMGSERLRPYLGAGGDILVTITSQDPVADESLIFTGTAPFDAPLIGGLIAQAPELAARGTPSGQGDIAIGGHAMAGVEIRLSKTASFNLEYRFTIGEGKNATLHTATAGLGLHF